jgi:alkane 1-monooxygenase
MAFTIPLTVYISLISTGLMCWLAIIYSFLVLPILELVASHFYKDKKPLTIRSKSKFTIMAQESLLYIAPVVQVFLILTFLREFDINSPVDLSGKIIGLGVSCGAIGINIGHELGHRSSLVPRLTSIFLLSTSLYSHFYIDHNKGHHRHIGTFQDPSTARYGENLYAFIFRSMTGSLKSAFQLDKKTFLLTQGFQLLILTLIYLNFGLYPTLAYTAAAFFGGVNLEIVNYIEHYGLTRKKNPSGRYEKVNPMHSWNSSDPLGRLVLFELPLHSDHHAYVSRRFYELENHEKAPQLPAGYSAMIVLATIPPLFFKLMNPRVKHYQS